MRDKAVAVEVEQSDVVAVQVEIASLARLQSQQATSSALRTCTASVSLGNTSRFTTRVMAVRRGSHLLVFVLTSDEMPRQITPFALHGERICRRARRSSGYAIFQQQCYCDINLV